MLQIIQNTIEKIKTDNDILEDYIFIPDDSVKESFRIILNYPHLTKGIFQSGSYKVIKEIVSKIESEIRTNYSGPSKVVYVPTISTVRNYIKYDDFFTINGIIVYCSIIPSQKYGTNVVHLYIPFGRSVTLNMECETLY